MPKTLLDCGNCGPDFSAISDFVSKHFGAEIVQSHGTEDTLRLLRERKFDLVTINRKLDRDYTDGLNVARAIKAEPELADTPVMLVTNYEEHQVAAMEVGCVRGFGKLALGDPATVALVATYLNEAPEETLP